MMKPSIAIIGAGLSGAVCARRLSDAGWRVEVFEKSRGVGGRMATRRTPVGVGDGPPIEFEFDHGAPAFDSSPATPAWDQWLQQAHAAGLIMPWACGEAVPRWVATPDMPAVCRWLLRGITVHTRYTVGSLQRESTGWALHESESMSGSRFDAVVVAIPPAQAAALLTPHRPDWALSTQAQAMSPCWTLMAVTDAPIVQAPAAAGDRLRMIVRQDTKPGRIARPGLAGWVAHARADWSHEHLEAAPDVVLPLLQADLAQAIGGVGRWHHAAVHRWRYAQFEGVGDPIPFRWEGPLGLGCCGDAWGGGGLEGAWHSAMALSENLLEGRA